MEVRKMGRQNDDNGDERRAEVFFLCGFRAPVTWKTVTGAVAVVLVLAAGLVLYLA